MLPCCFLQVLLPDLLQALLHLMLPVLPLPLQVLVFLLQVQVLVRLMLPVLQVPVQVLVLLLQAPVQAFLPVRCSVSSLVPVLPGLPSRMLLPEHIL